eukprot:scaffold34620_cov160-Amphora_coffeaeformis.AAC.11
MNPSPLPLLLLLSVLFAGTVQAWTSFKLPSTTTTTTTTTQLTAKPPPAASFDLEAIEAFEAQLDKEAEEALLGASTDDDDDDDDILVDDNSPQQDIRTWTVDDASHGKRIDAAIAIQFPDLSRSFCGSLVTDKRVHQLAGGLPELDDNETPTGQLLDRKSYKVQKGQVLQLSIPPQAEITEILAQDIPLNILHEDEHMIVLNKAAHMVVHPAAGNWDGTVVNALAYYLQHASPYGQGDFLDKTEGSSASDVQVEGTDGEPVNFRPGVVHRLDKGTTGVLVMAKTTQALAELSASFAARKVKKTYLAITVGNPGKRVVIDKPIGRHPIHRQRMRVVPNPHKHGFLPGADEAAPSSQTGRRALSFVDTIAFDGSLSLVQVRIETGRTHQIRVHLSDRRTPIYGDDVYGLSDWNKKLKEKQKIERPLLHAYRLEIDHPVTGQPMVFVAPLAEDMWRIARAICPPNQERETLSFLQDDQWE